MSQKKFQNKKILVITSCSAEKVKKKIKEKAINLYQGDFFKKVKKFVNLNDFDFRIISAKYGLLSPEEKILSYNKKIEKKEDIIKLREKINPKLNKLIDNYDKILLIMGKNYRNIIEPITNKKYVYFYDKRGLGGYKSLMKYLIKYQKKDLYKLIFEHKKNIITMDLLKQYNNKFANLTLKLRD